MKENHKVICTNCGKEHDGTYGSGRFCSKECAKSFSTKQDNPKELKEAKCSKCGTILFINKRASSKTCLCESCKHKKHEYRYKRICIICGNEFSVEADNTKHISKRKTCSKKCHTKLVSINSKNTYKKCKEEGRFVGWKSRNIISYAEKFWIEVLNNNKIDYIRELHVGKYFIDFYIEKNGKLLDLEIDGKQHKYEDRKKSDIERDNYLTNNNFIVYRIDWNEINTQKGKEQMKDKIEKFLSFYNSL